MTAPDTVKPLMKYTAKLGDDGNSYRGMMTSMFGSYYRVEEVDRIVAEKDARIAELEDSALGGYEDGWHALRNERDALRTQLADAVETLQKADSWVIQFTCPGVQHYSPTAVALHEKIKRLGVTGDKS